MGVIYLITNLANGKQYVGQTLRTLEERLEEHCSKHSKCLALHSAIEKYGRANFQIEQLDVGLDRLELNYKEAMWIKQLNTLSPHGYNLKDGGSNGKHSTETKQKMKDYWSTHERTPSQLISAQKLGGFHRGKPHSKSWNEKIGLAHEIKIDQYDLGGNLIATWRSLKDAADTLHIPRGNICRVCKGERHSAHGFIWKYHNELEVNDDVV